MRVLVTRPGADGQALVKILNDIGIEAILEPLLTIRHLKIDALNMDGVQGYLATSANGVKALVDTQPNLSIPLFAVGDTTALTARQGGFKTVHSASGDVSALARLVTDILEPAGGSLIHATTTSQAGDLKGQLENHGFECRTEIIYETEPSKILSSNTVAVIKSGGIDAVLLYSPRSAEIFVKLLRKSRLVRASKNLVVVCMSQAVAAKAELIQCEEILVATSPTQDALLNTLKNKFEIKHSSKDNLTDKHSQPELPKSNPHNQFVQPLQSNKGSTFKTIFYTILITAIIGIAAGATSDLWLKKMHNVFPFLSFQNENKVKLEFIAGRLKKLESQSINNIPRLEELEAEKKQLQTQLDSTLNRISTLDKSIAAAKQMIAAVDGGIGQDAALKTLNDLVKRLTKLEADSSSKVFKNEKQIGELIKQLETLKNKVPHSETNDLNIQSHNFLIAIGHLRSALRSGNSFKNELSSLNAIGPYASEILKTHEKLQDFSDAGIPTLIELEEAFSVLAGKIVQSTRLPDGNSLLDRTIARLSRSLN